MIYIYQFFLSAIICDFIFPKLKLNIFATNASLPLNFPLQVIYHDGCDSACEFNKTDATPSIAIAEFDT